MPRKRASGWQLMDRPGWRSLTVLQQALISDDLADAAFMLHHSNRRVALPLPQARGDILQRTNPRAHDREGGGRGGF